MVTLLSDLPSEGLRAGAIGVVLMIFESPELAYEVEFCDDDGRTIAEVALRAEQIERMSGD